MAWAYGELGDWSRGLEFTANGLGRLDASEQLAEGGPLRGLLLGTTAHLRMLGGDRTQAEAYLAEAEKLGPDIVAEFFGISVLFRTLIKGGVRLALGDFAGVLAIADDDRSRMREREMRCYLPDVLRTRGEALRGLGRADEAHESLVEARSEAERQGSRRSLWPVLATLAKLEEERDNPAEAESLRLEARGVIEYIADHADALGLRESFTSTPRVRAVLDATQG